MPDARSVGIIVNIHLSERMSAAGIFNDWHIILNIYNYMIIFIFLKCKGFLVTLKGKEER